MSVLENIRNDLSKINRLSAHKFEKLIYEIAAMYGLGRVEVGGNDLQFIDPNGKLFSIQCKFNRPTEKVGVADIRKFLEALDEDKGPWGLFVTNTDFSKPAKELIQEYRASLSALNYEQLLDWIRKSPKDATGPRYPQLATVKPYIASMTVKNVRCFGAEPQTIDFCNDDGSIAQWTVILGENGTGKTTLLQCITAFDATRDPSSGRTQPRGLTFDLNPLRPAFKRIGEVDEWSICAQMSEQADLNSLPITKAGLKPAVTITFNGGSRTISHTTTDPAIGPALCICYAYGANRRMGETRLSQIFPDDPTSTLFYDFVDLPNVEEWLLQLDYAATKNSPVQKSIKTLRDRVAEILVKLLPDVEKVRFGAPSRVRPQPAIEFLTPDGWLPSSSVAYGYRTFIAWVVDFASRMIRRYEDLPDPLAGPALVLVDEIDLHLHPKWQRNVMAYLSDRFPNTQFVVTAHNPVFVHAASKANLVLLHRGPKTRTVAIDNSPDVVRNWRIDQLITSDLVGLKNPYPPDIAELLDERKSLLMKRKLTNREQKRVGEIEAQIGPIPVGESTEEINSRKRLERTLEILEKQVEGVADDSNQ